MAEKEYIERDAAIKIQCVDCGGDGFCDNDCSAIESIKRVPAADVVPMSWVREHMSGDYISRKNAVENVLDQMRHSKSETAMRERLLNMVAADVRPVVRGKWVNYGDEYRPDIKCCMCGQRKPILLGNFNFNYCPNCGARMEES